MIDITVKSQCCGCSACVNICPKGCIKMQSDAEGFAYPQVDKSLCINCGLCEKVCPILHSPTSIQKQTAYAAKIKDEVLLAKSSSGGMFTALAQPVLEQGGVVFGAGFDKDWNVCHQYVETPADLDKLRRSKYVQSDIGQTFQQAKEFLEQGEKVFFTGTPCQIAGLKNYLGKEYENLLTADLICHGVPSPGVWRRFLQERFPQPGISAIDFRDKSLAWDASYLSVVYKGKKSPSLPFYLRPLRKLFFAHKAHLFRRLFKLPYGVSSLYERPSCYACPFKGGKRASDFTLGDFWGVQHIVPQVYDAKGVSVLLVNTPRAEQVFKQIQPQLVCQPLAFEDAVRYNPLFSRAVDPNPDREYFLSHYQTQPIFRLLRRVVVKKWLRRLKRE